MKFQNDSHVKNDYGQRTLVFPELITLNAGYA